MKIRNGYVSNSSSSSYVIIGKVLGNILNDVEIKKEDVDFSKNYFVFGGSLNDGEDIFELTEDMFDFIRKNKDKLQEYDCFDGTIVETVLYSDSGETIDIEKLYNRGFKELRVFAGDVDYHVSETIEDFKENYGLK